jgi:hypothetical protein
MIPGAIPGIAATAIAKIVTVLLPFEARTATAGVLGKALFSYGGSGDNGPAGLPARFNPAKLVPKNEKKACHLFLDSVIPVNSKLEHTKVLTRL